MSSLFVIAVYVIVLALCLVPTFYLWGKAKRYWNKKSYGKSVGFVFLGIIVFVILKVIFAVIAALIIRIFILG